MNHFGGDPGAATFLNVPVLKHRLLLSREGMLHANDESLNVDELRQRLRKMNDAALRGWGNSAKFMCSPLAPFGNSELTSSAMFWHGLIRTWVRLSDGSGAHEVSPLVSHLQGELSRRLLNLEAIHMYAWSPALEAL